MVRQSTGNSDDTGTPLHASGKGFSCESLTLMLYTDIACLKESCILNLLHVHLSARDLHAEWSWQCKFGVHASVCKVTACMTPWTPVWRWGENYTRCLTVQAVILPDSLLLTFPIELLHGGETLRLTQLPAWRHLSCTVKPSVPRKIKGDLYYACVIYSCSYFLCSRHGWKPIQSDWRRGKTNFFLASHCEYSCSHRLSLPLPKVSVDPQWVISEFLIFSLTHIDTFWGVQGMHTVILL